MMCKIDFPETQIRRANAIRPVFKLTLTQLVRDAVERHLDFLEERASGQTRRFTDGTRDKQDARKPRRGIRGALSQVTPPPSRTSHLERLISTPLESTAATPMVRVHDADDELYERAARALLGPSMEPKDVRRRAEAAVGLVRKERSLTAPSESEILARLEENYRRIKSEPSPTTQNYDTFVGTIVDLDKVKTAGEPIE